MQEGSLTKKIIRTQILKKRETLPSSIRFKAEKSIIQHILTLSIFQSAKHIALYYAFRGEVDLTELWKLSQTLNKKTYFPVVSKDKQLKTMTFREAASHDAFEINHFNIKEPTNTLSIDPQSLDCLFIPMVAFDQKGYRLGMGQGYYDRVLGSLKKDQKSPLCIGVAYSCQALDTLPHDRWDIPLDIIVTEEKIYYFNSAIISSICQ